LYACESWSITLREENRLRVYENRLLRSILGSKKEEVREGWKTVYKGEIYNLYSPPKQY
jgi:hypothetical protein